MNIQQDKRVIKPSKMSERYARWFETRVPSTSPLFRYIVMLFLAIPWSIVNLWLLLLSSMNWIPVFLLSLGVGISIYLLYLFILKSRFHTRITNEQFSRVVESAQEKTGSGGLVNVWQRNSPDPYIVSTFNSLFNAVIVSEPMIDLILKMPSSGEALLAFHLLRRPNNRNILDIVVAMLIFSFFSSYVAQLLPYFLSPYPPYIMLVVLVIVIGFIYFSPVIIILLLRGAFWAHTSAFERAAGLYKMHPQVARDEVLTSVKLDEEAAKSIIWVVKEWERRKRDSRRLSMTALILCMTYLVSYYLLIQSGLLAYAFLIGAIYPILFILLVPGVFTYLFLRRWDKKCMGEIYYETTAAHEPIWVD